MFRYSAPAPRAGFVLGDERISRRLWVGTAITGLETVFTRQYLPSTDLLVHETFKGRSIVTSDRNRTETIWIKEPINTSSMAENLTFPHMAPAAVQAMSTYHAAAMYPMAFSTLGLPDAMTVAAPGVRLGNLTTNDMPQGPPRGFVVTEHRKVLVTQLGNGAQVEKIKSWIHKTAGTYADTISSIVVPCQRSSTKARGHAYIIFETVSAAAHAIKLLDASRFKGRQVSARLTTEGLSRTAEAE
jgi:RNA recognition motif-containing protein